MQNVNGNENVSGRDAILFLPGLGERVLSQSAKDIAQKMARAIDLNAQTESATLSIQSIAPLRYGVDGNREAQAAQIVRKDGEEKRIIADLFRVQYHDILFQGLDKRGPLAQLRFLSWHGIELAWRWFDGLFRNWRVGDTWDGFSLRKRIQLLIGAVLLLVLWVGLVLVILSGLSAPALEGSAYFASQEKFPELMDIVTKMREWVYPVIVALTGVLSISRTNLKEGIRNGALQLAAINDYLSSDGYKRNQVVADVESALETLVESQEYSRIILIGYSLGSVIALDTMHMNPQPSLRVQQRLDALVTVGCPFDVITTYWPQYFIRNEPTPLRDKPWHNIYSPKDVLGSDFRLLGRQRTSPHTNQAYPQVRADVSDIWFLRGLSAHVRYWNVQNPNDPAVWSPVVNKVFDYGHWALD